MMTTDIRRADYSSLILVLAGLLILSIGWVLHAAAQADLSRVAVSEQRLSDHDRRIQSLEDKAQKIDFVLYGLFANLGATGIQVVSQVKRRQGGKRIIP